MRLAPTSHVKAISRQSGMTIAEMMVAAGIFSLVTLAIAYASMFGMKVDQLTQSKLGASDEARLAFNKFAMDVRSAKVWAIGNGTIAANGLITNFVGAQIGGTNYIQGNAIRISLSTDTNTYICYFFNTNQGKLLRMHSGLTNYSVIAQYLTNSSGTNTMYFNNQNYVGSTNMTQNHKSVVNVLLQFSQYQYPLTHVGAGFYYDYYRLSFKLTPHVPDGP